MILLSLFLGILGGLTRVQALHPVAAHMKKMLRYHNEKILFYDAIGEIEMRGAGIDPLRLPIKVAYDKAAQTSTLEYTDKESGEKFKMETKNNRLTIRIPGMEGDDPIDAGSPGELGLGKNFNQDLFFKKYVDNMILNYNAERSDPKNNKYAFDGYLRMEHRLQKVSTIYYDKKTGVIERIRLLLPKGYKGTYLPNYDIKMKYKKIDGILFPVATDVLITYPVGNLRTNFKIKKIKLKKDNSVAPPL